MKYLYGLYSSLALIHKVYDAVSTTVFVCLLVACMHLYLFCIYLHLSFASVLFNQGGTVLFSMCVGMEAFNVFCCVRAVANLCPLTETSMCAKRSREGGRGRASTHYAMMSSSLWSSDTKWLFEVMVQRAQQETKHYYVCCLTENVCCVCQSTYVRAWMYIYMYICMASPQEVETEAAPLLSAALIYLDVHDVILPGVLPSQA